MIKLLRQNGCHRIGSIRPKSIVEICSFHWFCVGIFFSLSLSLSLCHNAIVFAPSSAFFKSRELFLSDQEWDNCWHARMTCNAVHYRHKWGKTALTAQGKYEVKELGNLGPNGSKFGTGKAHTVRWLVAPLKCSQMREAMIAATWGQLWPSAPGGQSRWFDKRLGVKWKIYCAAQPGFVSCCNQEASCLEIGFRVVFQPWDKFFSFLIRSLCFSPRGFGCFKTLT